MSDGEGVNEDETQCRPCACILATPCFCFGLVRIPVLLSALVCVALPLANGPSSSLSSPPPACPSTAATCLPLSLPLLISPLPCLGSCCTFRVAAFPPAAGTRACGFSRHLGSWGGRCSEGCRADEERQKSRTRN